MANWWDKNLTDAQKFRLQDPQNPSLLQAISNFPVVAGDIASGLLATQDVARGNYGQALANGIGLLPFVPSMGGTIKSVNKGMFKGLLEGSVDIANNPLFVKHASMPNRAAVAGDDGYMHISQIKGGDYVLRYNPPWGSTSKQFNIIGDNPSELAKYGTDRLAKSDKAIANASKLKENNSLLGRLKSEYGDNFTLGSSTQSKSKYITHTPSGTKIRISDHDLPLGYEQPDLNLNINGDVDSQLEKIRGLLGDGNVR